MKNKLEIKTTNYRALINNGLDYSKYKNQAENLKYKVGDFWG